ncbi:MAG: hypothetical protein ACREFP_15665 [Acetobacteraceae bacterium]
MATAGASTLAGRCGLPERVAPLLALAALQALWEPTFGTLRHRAEFLLGWSAWLAIGPANEHSGVHTVPLGLAVIAGELIGLGAGEATPWLLLLAGSSLAPT